MRSIRGRLLITLLFLITFVMCGLAWYVYHEMTEELRSKELITEKLLETQYRTSCTDWEERFKDELLREAEQLARQVTYRVESKPEIYKPEYQAGFQTGIVPGLFHPHGGFLFQGHLLSVGWAAEVADPRVANELFYKRSFDVMDARDEDYFQIQFGRTFHRSRNLREDCMVIEEAERRRMVEYVPVFHDTKMTCGKQLKFVAIKMPLLRIEQSLWRFGPPRIRTQPNTPRVANNRARPESRQTNWFPTIIVQVAKEKIILDELIEQSTRKYTSDLQRLHDSAEATRSELFHRLLVICIITIAATALGVTWLSRSSLKPLIEVADAVSHLSPQDLRLKIRGREPKPNELPDELEPIVARLQQSLGSLEQAFNREKRATADISHELRTPLASLITTAQVALRKPRTAEEYRATLQQCVETGSHLTTLVERLLMLSRLDAGVDPIRREPVDIVELAGQCVDILRPLADQQGIEIELEVDDSASALGEIEGDAGKLREILVNLIDNAVNYNKPNGHVTVRVSTGSNKVTFEVEDTGVGMSPETRSHLFERFYRADPSRQSETVNAGLGLAIVKGYVDLMQGSIDVRSSLNQGSTFRISFPLVKASSQVALV